MKYRPSTSEVSPKNNLSNTSTRSRYAKVTAAVAVAIIVSGCSGNLRKLPSEAEIDIPSNWTLSKEQSQTSDIIKQGGVVDGWVATFDDQQYLSYAQQALDGNPNLRASAAQLKSAIEQVTIAGAAILPGASIGANKSGTDTETNGVETKLRSASANLNINWEADIWGKLTQRRKSAAYSAKSQTQTYRAAEMSLVANVGRAWYNLITNKLQVELAQQRLESFERTASIIEENYQRGLRSALDVYLSRSDVQVQISSLADAEFNYSASLRAFKNLLGEYPDTLLNFEAKLPELNTSIPVGLPAELMERRPDIQASRFQYKSAVASAKAAHRDRFPSLSFTGSIGDTRDNLDNLFDGDNIIKNLVGGVTLPIFQAGALRSRSHQAAFQAESAYANFVSTSLSAFEEVENAIDRETTLREQHTALKKAVELAQGGLDLALDRYQSGIENYQTVLQSQRSVFNSKLNELNIRNALLQNRISLHLALGGDFGGGLQRHESK